MTDFLLPELPRLVWRRVFRHALLGLIEQQDSKGILDLWNSVRTVLLPGAQRSDIAQVYLNILICDPNRCRIDFDDIGLCWLSEHAGNGYDEWVSMTFDRIDPKDSTRVVFSEIEETREMPGWWEDPIKRQYSYMKYLRWKESLDYYIGIDVCRDIRPDYKKFHAAMHMVRCTGFPVSLDVPLTEMQFDLKAREISFKWEDMLSALFSERSEIWRRVHPVFERYDTIARPTRNQHMKFGKQVYNLIKDVRLTRIRRQYEAVGIQWKGIDPENEIDDEDQVLERIVSAPKHPYDLRVDQNEDLKVVYFKTARVWGSRFGL